MKWTNRGNQLDALGRKYLNITDLYIWGAGVNGHTILSILEWLDIANDFKIVYCDSDPQKVGTKFHGKDVISAKSLCSKYDEKSAIIVSSTPDINVMLDKMNISYFKFIFTVPFEHNQTNNFIQNFLCVWYMYKHGKLLSHSTNYVTTTRCNLNCKGCLNLQSYIKNQRDYSFNEFKKHIDIVFSKFDFLFSFHFSGGECFLNKDFPKMLHYLHDRYGNRIYTLFCITNGTVIPSDELLHALKDSNCSVNIDDYRKTVPKAKSSIPLLKDLLNKKKISFSWTSADKWIDLSLEDTDNTDKSENELIEWHDNCNLYLQAFQDGKIYACCYEGYALTAGIVNEADCLDIAQTSTMELLEYRFGFTKSGYVKLCKHCRGLGDNAIWIDSAEQIVKRNKFESGK